MSKRTITPPADLTVGSVHTTKHCGDFTIKAYNNANDITIRFHDTGYMRTVRASNIRNRSITDHTLPHILGIGMPGMANAGKKHPKVYGMWRRMIQSTYYLDEDHVVRETGTHKLHPNWHSFLTFLEWYEDNKLSPEYVFYKDLINKDTIIGPYTSAMVPPDIKSLPLFTHRLNLPETCALEAGYYHHRPTGEMSYSKTHIIYTFLQHGANELESLLSRESLGYETHCVLFNVVDKIRNTMEEDVLFGYTKYSNGIWIPVK